MKVTNEQVLSHLKMIEMAIATVTEEIDYLLEQKKLDAKIFIKAGHKDYLESLKEKGGLW